MATVNVRIPSPREPVVDENGIMTREWWIFFENLWTRTGAATTDKVEAGATAATTAAAAAATAQAAADDAQALADEVEERFDFGFGFDLEP